MHLSEREQISANKKRALISKHFPEGIRLCNDCSGTGLDNVHFLNGDASWDGYSFCDKCKGIGYLSWKETITMKLCPKCQGGGGYEKVCSTCNNKGTLDWIQYMRVGDKNG
jgi:DnaJ-class molecular chaperone